MSFMSHRSIFFMAMLENIDISKEIEDRPIAFVVKGLNEEEFEPVMRGVMTLENMSFLIEEIHPNYRGFFSRRHFRKK